MPTSTFSLVSGMPNSGWCEIRSATALVVIAIPVSLCEFPDPFAVLRCQLLFTLVQTSALYFLVLESEADQLSAATPERQAIDDVGSILTLVIKTEGSEKSNFK